MARALPEQTNNPDRPFYDLSGLFVCRGVKLSYILGLMFSYSLNSGVSGKYVNESGSFVFG